MTGGGAERLRLSLMKGWFSAYIRSPVRKDERYDQMKLDGACVAHVLSYDHFWCMTGEESGVIC